MNNFDIKDNPNLINNQEDGLFETERISEFMDVLKGEFDNIGKTLK